MRMRAMVMAAATGLVLVLSACGNGAPVSTDSGGGGGASANIGKGGTDLGTPTVTAQATSSLTFTPNKLTVKAGSVIQWTNTGGVPHNVTFDSYQSLTSPTMQQGDTWEVQITTPGTYAYHCTFHPGMDGQITVT